MADQEQESGREPLTKREREVIQELAREIVREAGIAPDTERMVQLERDKAQNQLHRTMALLNAALLAGIGAVAVLLPAPIYLGWLGVSVTMNAASIGTALLGLVTGTRVAGEDEGVRHYRVLREAALLGTVITFGLGLLTLDLFAILNWRLLL